MLSREEQDKLIQYLNEFKGKESEVKIQLISGKWFNLDKRIIVEVWLEERQKEREKNNSKHFECLSLGISFLTFLAAVFSGISAWKSADISKMLADQEKQAQRVQLRPYVKVMLTNPILPYDDSGIYVVLPYQLENTGSSTALDVRRQYTSYLIDKVGKENKVQTYQAPNIGDILPAQRSPLQPDDINISGFNLEDLLPLKVELKIVYHGPPEIDSRAYCSKTVLILYPQKLKNGKILFYISIPMESSVCESDEKLNNAP